MAMKLLVERLGHDAAYCTHTLLNAIPQRPIFNRGIWLDLEYLTGAWAQVFGRIWVIQGPVFYQSRALTWIGEEDERQVAVPDAVFKIVIRNKTGEEQRQTEPRHQSAPEILAFLYPQLDRAYFRGREGYRHEQFLTTVDVIEELIGLDFKPSTDAVIERRIERHRSTALWDPPVVDRKLRRVFLSGCRK